MFHHNNNFNLINIYSAKTITIEYKICGFNVLNRFQTYSNSIACAITTFDVLLCNFFFHNAACANFFMPSWGSAIFFYKFFHSPGPSLSQENRVRKTAIHSQCTVSNNMS